MLTSKSYGPKTPTIISTMANTVLKQYNYQYLLSIQSRYLNVCSIGFVQGPACSFASAAGGEYAGCAFRNCAMSCAIQSCILDDGWRLSTQISPPDREMCSGPNPCDIGSSRTRVNVSHDEKNSAVMSGWAAVNWTMRSRSVEFHTSYMRPNSGWPLEKATPADQL